MDLEYIIKVRSGGANPFKIFSELSNLNPDALCFAIRRMPYAIFLQSNYWLAVSMTAKSRAGMRCQVCNCPDEIQVHHRDYSNHGREHLNMMDLVVLCHNCHGLFHGHKTFVPPQIRLRDEQKTTKFKLPKNFVVPHEESEIVMPDGDPIVITNEMLNSCRAHGSFTNATLRAFGLKRKDVTSGWGSRLIGTTISREKYREAQEGKFIYKSGRL